MCVFSTSANPWLTVTLPVCVPQPFNPPETDQIILGPLKTSRDCFDADPKLTLPVRAACKHPPSISARAIDIHKYVYSLTISSTSYIHVMYRYLDTLAAPASGTT